MRVYAVVFMMFGSLCAAGLMDVHAGKISYRVPVRTAEAWPGWLDDETIQLRVTMSLPQRDSVGPYGGVLMNAVQLAQRASAALYADTVSGAYAKKPPKTTAVAMSRDIDFTIKGGMVLDVKFEDPYRCTIVYRQPARGIIILPGKGDAIAKDAYRTAEKPRFPVDGAIDYDNPPKNLATEWWEDDSTLRIRAWGAPRFSGSSRADRRYHAADAAEIAAQARVLAIVRGITVRGGRFADPDSRSGAILEKRFDENDTCEILYEVKRKGLRMRIEAGLVGRASETKRAPALTSRPADPAAGNRASLHIAVASGDLAHVSQLLDQGAIANARDDAGRTPLFHVASAGVKNKQRMFDALRARGGDIGAVDAKGNTLLHEYAAVDDAALRGIIGYLLKTGACINCMNDAGDTPLHRAVAADCRETAELLLGRGAVVNLKNNTGHTPLDVAQRMGSKKLESLLLGRGAR